MKAKLLKIALPAAIVTGFCWAPAKSQASLIPLGRGTNYVQNFNSLPNKGKSSTMPLPGWSFLGVRDAGNFIVADDGNDLDGGVKSYGLVGSSNRALGVNTAANGDSGIFGVDFQNAGPGIINRLNISYTGEEWRLGVPGVRNTLELQYSLNATGLGDTKATWNNVPGLSFGTPNTSGAGMHNGTLAINQVPVSGSISFLNIPQGGSFWVRWIEVGTHYGVPGDGLAVDNFSLSAVPETSTFAAAFGALGMLGVTFCRRRSVRASVACVD